MVDTEAEASRRSVKASGPAIEPPAVDIYTFFPDARPPEPASSSVNGSLPVRAYQYCSPVVAGSGFGWYLYPPRDFALRWNGVDTDLALMENDELGEWKSLAGGKDFVPPDAMQQLGEMSEQRREELGRIMAAGGLELANCDPRAPQLVEVHLGFVMRTSPGWSTAFRSVPNWPYTGYLVLDGIIETAWFRSFIATPIRLTEMNRIVRFYRNQPFAAMQVVPDVSYQRDTMKSAQVVRGIGAIPEDTWQEILDIRSGRFNSTRRGHYRREQREYAAKTGQCPVDTGSGFVADDGSEDAGPMIS
jgi:Family of unknown function (DUF6065)